MEKEIEPVDVNYELDVIDQMMSKPMTTSTTFLRIWNTVTFRLGIFFIVAGVMMAIFMVFMRMMQSDVLSANSWNAPVFTILVGVTILLANFLSTKLLK